jgi:LysM repeat protein
LNVSKPPEDLKPLPKPVRLEVQRDKPGPPEKRGRSAPIQEKRRQPTPPALPKAEKDLRYFEQAQRSHGHRRPSPTKPPKKPKPPGRITRGLGIFALALVCVGLVILGAVMLTSNNALAVYLDDERIGYVPLNRETREWDPAYIQAQAVNHRAASLDAVIQVNERVSLRPVRANRRYVSNITIIIGQISNSFTYQISATAVYVDGERIAVLRTRGMAEHVAGWFTFTYTNPATIETAIDGWEYKTVLVTDDALESVDTAIERLDRQIEAILEYIVRDGDTKGAIALRHGIPLNRLLSDNNLTADATIRPGDRINIRTTRPFLTVRTTEEVIRTESLPMEIINRDNDQLAVGDIRIIQEGREGERELTVRIYYINGQQISEEIVSARNTVEPETRVVEIGTLETATPDWR